MSHIYSLGKILLCGFQLLQPNYDWNLIETDTKIQINSNTTIESQEIRESRSLPPRIRELGLSLPILYPNYQMPLFPSASLFIMLTPYSSYIEVMQITIINI